MLIIIWIFLLTLYSYYFQSIGLALFNFLGGFFSLFMLFFYKAVYRSYMKPPIILVLLVFLISLLTSLNYSQHFIFSRFLFYAPLLPLVILSSYLLNEKKIELYKAIKFVLAIHLVFFLAQFIAFYLFNVFIDFIEPITGVNQRSLGGSYTLTNEGIKLIRSAGLFNEPGTFSNFVFILFSIKKYLESSVYSKFKIEKIDYLTLLCILLSFSTFGLLFVLIFILYTIKTLNKKNIIPLIIVLIPILFMAYENYFKVRFSKSIDNSGIGFRLDGINVYLENAALNIFNLLFGYSNMLDINEIFKTHYVYNDIGFLFTVILNYGIIGFILFMFFTIPKFKSKGLLLLALFFCKIPITSYFLWLLIVIIFDKNEK